MEVEKKKFILSYTGCNRFLYILRLTTFVNSLNYEMEAVRT